MILENFFGQLTDELLIILKIVNGNSNTNACFCSLVPVRFRKGAFDKNYKATIGVDFEMERFEVLGVPFSLQL